MPKVVISVLIFLLLIGTGYYFYQQNQAAPIPSSQTENAPVPSEITANTPIEDDLTALERDLAEIQQLDAEFEEELQGL